MPLIHRILNVKESFPAVELGDQVGIPATVMRGGTSRAVFFHASDLPRDKGAWDTVFVSAIGSYEPKHIDGLGGMISQSSKIAVINPSKRSGVDIDYFFSQVRPYEPSVDHEGNCGNISSAVGPFAVEEGLVEPEEPSTKVRILNTNTNKLILSEVPVRDGKVVVSGGYELPGIAGLGAPIKLTFMEPGGSVTGKALPTGNVKDEIVIEGLGRVEYSLVDAANPVVFVKAEDLGLKGIESPDEIDSREGVLDRLEYIRVRAAQRAGIVGEGGAISDSVPKVAIVARPTGYIDSSGRKISQGEVDLVARAVSMKRIHKTYALTVAIATAAAARMEGTVVNEVVGDSKGDGERVRIGHPAGVIEVGIKIRGGDVEWASVYRTARTIMKGLLFLPRERLSSVI